MFNSLITEKIQQLTNSIGCINERIMKNIHLLPTDKPSRLKQNKITKKKSLVNKGIDLTDYTPINIYITNSEEIKEGWCIDNRNTLNKIINVTNGYLMFENGNSVKTINCKKIILTDNKDLIADGVQSIDDEFLEWFCSKNGKVDFVEVIAIEDEKN